ncbi:methylase, partial [Achromatium sp. WMS2]
GNFLVIAYRELRLLELDILKLLYSDGNRSLDIGELNVLCDVDQFYGIEQEEFPAQIAQTALWLMDHQMNLLVSEYFGTYYQRLPLKKAATIVHGNALRLDWRTICPHADFILGNPPFVGKTYRSAEQNTDMDLIFKGVTNYRSLDYVTCWYRQATAYMRATPHTRCAFVSTNSITQGEQVSALWPDLLAHGVIIHFAHRTFQWTSEASGKAAVHCVIIGFGLHNIEIKRLFDYATPKSEPSEKIVTQINPYLIPASPVIIETRSQPICDVSPMVHGNIPVDGGNLLLSSAEKEELLAKEPQAAPWIRPLLGSEEFINGKERWCLWLVGIEPQELRAMPEVMKRITAVKTMRESSIKTATVERAATSFLFAENRQPQTGHYILVPRVSSERRPYIPMGFIDSSVISTDANQMIPNATMYEFGILESAMHMAWMRAVAGRLESRYRYSATIVYNNFPWPTPTTKQRELITTAAQRVLDARSQHPGATLADLYDPITMPLDLQQAHRKLDLAVDTAYSNQKFTGDSDRVALLFALYQKITQGLLPSTAKTKTRAKRTPKKDTQ